jgi:hypothetical protein
MARRRLVAHRSDRLGRWPDPADPGIEHGLREAGVLGEETEARVDRVGVRAGRCCHDGIDVEEIDRTGTVRRRDDGREAESITRSTDPIRDVAPVGDEDALDGARLGP